jgi:hypothetical protein
MIPPALRRVRHSAGCMTVTIRPGFLVDDPIALHDPDYAADSTLQARLTGSADFRRSITTIPFSASRRASTANAERSMPDKAAAADQRACSSASTRMEAFTERRAGGTADFRRRGAGAVTANLQCEVEQSLRVAPAGFVHFRFRAAANWSKRASAWDPQAGLSSKPVLR